MKQAVVGSTERTSCVVRTAVRLRSGSDSARRLGQPARHGRHGAVGLHSPEPGPSSSIRNPGGGGGGNRGPRSRTRRMCGGTGALTDGLAGPRSGKQAVIPLLTCTNPISGEPPMPGWRSYSVSCPQLTQRISHSCSWAYHRKNRGTLVHQRLLMFLGLAQPHYLVVDVPRAVPRAASPPPVNCTLTPPVAASSQRSALVDVLPEDRPVRCPAALLAQLPVRLARLCHAVTSVRGGRSGRRAARLRLREDRLLHEAEATDGGPRRICDLFGLAVGAALRYSRHHRPTRLVEHSLRSAGDALSLRQPEVAGQRAGVTDAL